MHIDEREIHKAYRAWVQAQKEAHKAWLHMLQLIEVAIEKKTTTYKGLARILKVNNVTLHRWVTRYVQEPRSRA